MCNATEHVAVVIATTHWSLFYWILYLSFGECEIWVRLYWVCVRANLIYNENQSNNEVGGWRGLRFASMSSSDNTQVLFFRSYLATLRFNRLLEILICFSISRTRLPVSTHECVLWSVSQSLLCFFFLSAHIYVCIVYISVGTVLLTKCTAFNGREHLHQKSNIYSIEYFALVVVCTLRQRTIKYNIPWKWAPSRIFEG